MEKRKKVNKIYLLAILVFILSLMMLLFTYYLKSSIILNKEEIDVKLIITDVAGFSVTNQSLDFGGLRTGTSSYKKILIINDYDFPIRAEFDVKGDISDFLIDNLATYLDVGEKKNVTISTIEIPEGTEYGNYTGKMIITFKKDI